MQNVGGDTLGFSLPAPFAKKNFAISAKTSGDAPKRFFGLSEIFIIVIVMIIT